MHIDEEALPVDKRDLSNADADAELPKPYALTKAYARAVSKRGGSSRWAQKLCGLLEGFIQAPTQENSHLEWPSEFNQQQQEITGWDVAAEVWDALVALEDDAQLCLKEHHKALKKKSKKRGTRKEGTSEIKRKVFLGLPCARWDPLLVRLLRMKELKIPRHLLWRIRRILLECSSKQKRHPEHLVSFGSRENRIFVARLPAIW